MRCLTVKSPPSGGSSDCRMSRNRSTRRCSRSVSVPRTSPRNIVADARGADRRRRDLNLKSEWENGPYTVLDNATEGRHGFSSRAE